MTFVPSVALRSITESSVTTYGLGLGVERELAADTVCIVTYHDLNDELAEYLAQHHGDATFNVHVIGNANGTDTIQAAIHSAAKHTRVM